MTKTEEKSPYTIVAIQECERMNILTTEIRRSLSELNLGLKVKKYYCNLDSITWEQKMILNLSHEFELNTQTQNPLKMSYSTQN